MKRDQPGSDPDRAAPDTPLVLVQTSTPDAAGSGDPRPEPFYADLPQFVERFVLPHCRNQLFDVRWCARWWEHTAAVTRLELLWEAFEHLRLEEPPAMSVWLLEHFDAHMAVLTKPTGVFWQCDASEGVHSIPPLWPHLIPPVGEFSRERNSDDTAVVPLTSISRERTTHE